MLCYETKREQKRKKESENNYIICGIKGYIPKQNKNKYVHFFAVVYYNNILKNTHLSYLYDGSGRDASLYFQFQLPFQVKLSKY